MAHVLAASSRFARMSCQKLVAFRLGRHCSTQAEQLGKLKGLEHNLDSSPQSLTQDGAARLIGAAGKGDVQAQLFLGQCLYDGNGYIKRNVHEAMHWLRRAAETGDASAQYYCGRALDESKGVTRSTREAVSWYKKSAKQGFAAAQANYGIALFEGEGVKQNHRKAFKWFSRAAEQGDASAQFRLGCCYADGCDGVVDEDLEKAAKWFSQAAQQGHTFAQLRLGVQLLNGDGVAEDREAALSWLKKASPNLPDGVHPIVDEMKARVREKQLAASE